jgi:hypothetical protein
VPRAGKGPATKEPRGWSTLRATESGSIVVVGTFALAYRGIFLRARFPSGKRDRFTAPTNFGRCKVSNGGLAAESRGRVRVRRVGLDSVAVNARQSLPPLR